MATGVLSPSPIFTGWDQNGDPLPGGKLETYLAGTSTPAATYTDVGLLVPNANPVILDAAGRCVLFLVPAQSYKYVLRNAAGAIQWTQDNISAGTPGSPTLDITGTGGEALGAGKVVYLSDGSGGNIAGRWYLTQTANAYSSTLPVIGMTIAAIGGGGTGVIRTQGIVTGLSGLVVGTTYTAGDAGTLATGGARIVGQADSITSLVLDTRNTPSAVSTVTMTGDITALPLPPGSGNLTIRMNNQAPAMVRGIAPGLPGQQLTVLATSTFLVQFAYGDAAAPVGNRIITFVSSAPTSLYAGPAALSSAAAQFVYDGSGRWLMVAHEQGAWITPPYSAANFTGSAGTWTVDAGDIATMRYRLSGRTITLAYVLTTTSVSAGGADLRMGSGVWGGFVSAQTMSNGLALASDNGTTVAARHAVTAGGSTLFLNRNDNLSWGAAVNTSYLQGQIAFEVN